MKAVARKQISVFTALRQTPRLTKTCFVLFFLFLERKCKGAAMTEKAKVGVSREDSRHNLWLM